LRLRHSTCLLLIALHYGLIVTSNLRAQQTIVERGGYLLHAAGCITCHTEDTDGAVQLAGGRELKTPFGSFFSPNITADVETGIGSWSDDDFVQAFRQGMSPDGQHYFPAFPFPSYAGMRRDDLVAIRAYLFSLPPASRENRNHRLRWYLRSRLAAGAWKWLYFRPEPFSTDEERSDAWNRGAYLVRHLGHCGECHTPRNVFGAPISGRELAGTQGDRDNRVPNITPHPDAGIGDWSRADIMFYLELGMLPDGDFAGGRMAAVIDDSTSRLTTGDRGAIATYLATVAAVKAPLP